eukprot:2149335-Prymnesium_polylepis.1
MFVRAVPAGPGARVPELWVGRVLRIFYLYSGRFYYTHTISNSMLRGSQAAAQAAGAAHAPKPQLSSAEQAARRGQSSKLKP